MSTAVLTSKGQVTIPAEVRRRRGIDTGDRIEFVEVEGGGFVIKPAVDDVRSLKGLLSPVFLHHVLDANAQNRGQVSQSSTCRQ